MKYIVTALMIVICLCPLQAMRKALVIGINGCCFRYKLVIFLFLQGDLSFIKHFLLLPQIYGVTLCIIIVSMANKPIRL